MADPINPLEGKLRFGGNHLRMFGHQPQEAVPPPPPAFCVDTHSFGRHTCNLYGGILVVDPIGVAWNNLRWKLPSPPPPPSPPSPFPSSLFPPAPFRTPSLRCSQAPPSGACWALRPKASWAAPASRPRRRRRARRGASGARARAVDRVGYPWAYVEGTPTGSREFFAFVPFFLFLGRGWGGGVPVLRQKRVDQA